MVAQQKKSLDVHRGLFLIRYDSADDTVNPPRVMISTDPNAPESVKLILPPGSEEAVLWSPGACLVLQVSHSGRIELAIAPAQPNGSVSARIQLVPLSNDPAGIATLNYPVFAAPERLDVSQIQVLGHVAGIGDTVARSGEWIAGPMAPSRIEGIAIEWANKPRSIDLRYAVRIGGPRPAPTPMVDAGAFAGTRGRALPLVGATLEISGPGAGGHQLVVDAVFLGSPQMRVGGQRVVLSGPTGREPLVGLRVGLEPVDQPKSFLQMQKETQLQSAKQNPTSLQLSRGNAISVVAHEPAPTTRKSRKPKGRVGRVRVFRSNIKRGK